MLDTHLWDSLNQTGNPTQKGNLELHKRSNMPGMPAIKEKDADKKMREYEQQLVNKPAGSLFGSLCSVVSTVYNQLTEAPISQLIADGNRKKVEELLKGGVNPGFLDSSGRTLLDHATCASKPYKVDKGYQYFSDPSMVELLIKYGADVEQVFHNSTVMRKVEESDRLFS